jgi:hypothetical protein
MVGDDEIGGNNRRVAGRVRVGHEDHAVAQRDRATAGGTDAHLGLHAHNDQPVDSGAGEAPMQIGAVEGAAMPLLDDHLAGARRDHGMMRPTRRSLAEDVARTAIVLHMNDREPFGVGARQEPGDALQDFVAAIERLAYGEHALLHVDDHQCARHRTSQ